MRELVSVSLSTSSVLHWRFFYLVTLINMLSLKKKSYMYKIKPLNFANFTWTKVLSAFQSFSLSFALLFIPLPVFLFFLICVMSLYIQNFLSCIARIFPGFPFYFYFYFFCNIYSLLFNTANLLIFIEFLFEYPSSTCCEIKIILQ